MFQCRSYNRRMNVWYVYEVDYVWDEAKQKKVQKRRCIGKIDPETNQVIPNGKRGPARVVPNVSGQSDGSSGSQCSKSKSQRPGSSSSLLSRRKFEAKLQKLSRTIKDLSEQLEIISHDLDEFAKRDQSDEEQS